MSSKTLIIAEVGSVHDGSFGNAVRLIDVAADCLADAVKFQMHIAQEETLPTAPSPPYFNAEPRYAYFERTAFSAEQWRQLKLKCEERRVEFLCSPFSIAAVERLDQTGVQRYKIPSGEITNIPLLESVARTGRPVLLSSGMSSWQELDRAVDVILKHNSRLVVLQCTSEYPCPDEHVGLNVMIEMGKRYNVPFGLSDHTLSNYAAYAAVTLGASVIEKHLTFSRKMYGSDARHSVEPEEFSALVQGIRSIERILASPVDKNDIGRFQVMKETFEKSVVSLAPIPAGALITSEMVGIRKPGTGLPASRLQEVIGSCASRDIPPHSVLQEVDLKWK